MTVKQLMKKLSKLPEDAKVIIPNDPNYIEGCYTITDVDDCTFSEDGAVLIETDYADRIDY